MYDALLQRPLALPVFVDFQRLTGFDAQHIATHVVREVCRTLGQRQPRRGRDEPMQWLQHTLENAVKLLGDRCLLIIVDEFDVLLKMARAKRLDRHVFTNLRSVMTARRQPKWLLITQEIALHDFSSWGLIGPLVQLADSLRLQPFEPHWARKLAREPAERCGLGYESGLESRIWDLTAGNPYFIQVLCFNVVDRVLGLNRTNVTADDLDRVVPLIINDGSRYFAHFLESLQGITKTVLVAVAASCAPGEWVDIREVNAALRGKGQQLSSEARDKAIQELAWQGMVELRQEAGSRHIRIPIRLFHDWVKYFMCE
jgi:hypothetical protein